MPVKPTNREYLVKEIVKEITNSGNIPVEHRDRFEEDLLRDVDSAVHRFRVGMVGVMQRKVSINEILTAA